jgi:hypothetical protein
MSIIKLDKNNFEAYTLVVNPSTNYTSSSLGVTGSINLFTDYSKCLKDIEPSFLKNDFDSLGIENLRNQIIVNPWISGSIDGLEEYLEKVNNHPVGKKQGKEQDITRFEPGVKLDKNFQKKRIIKDNLFPYYKNVYNSADWAFTNYNCFKFFLSNEFQNNASLVYPAINPEDLNLKNHYAPDDDFTISFWIKPTPSADVNIRNFTVLHMSSSFAISLVSDSIESNVDGYRLLFQFGESADIPPSSVSFDVNKEPKSEIGNDEFLFCSTNASVKINTWNHVAIRWTGKNDVTGYADIVINNIIDNKFNMIYNDSIGEDSIALFVGNYYQGSNESDSSILRFFNHKAASKYGLLNLDQSPNESDPINFFFNHQLNAELHDIRIYNKFKYDISELHKFGLDSISEDLIFYLPFMYSSNENEREILQTPFFSQKQISNDPFNVALSFSVGGFELNLENFTKEFVRNVFPRAYGIESDPIDSQVDTTNLTANDILHGNGLIIDRSKSIRRTYSIAPCDNGLFIPNFDILKLDDKLETFVDTRNATNLSKIKLDNLVDMNNFLVGPQSIDDTVDIDIMREIEGASPEEPGISPGTTLTVLRRVLDPSSNEVVIFDISNMFYGDLITPGSLILKDRNPLYLNSEFEIELRDNGIGSIYRNACKSEIATWNNVGNILYEEGLIVIKSPVLRFFGKNGFEISFKGERKVYVLEVLIPLEKNHHNISSNKSYTNIKPTDNINEIADSFTYITSVNLHDSNMNVMARANLAQPIVKRESDKYLIKLRMDF